MRLIEGQLTCSATDAANFIACRHKTRLDVAVATGRLSAPTWEDPLAKRLRARGQAHENRYVADLQRAGRVVTDLSRFSGPDRAPALAATRAAMRDGADVIVQAALGSEEWFGYADVLARVEAPSGLGDWSYEAHDTKLARETRGGTVLQLCVYSELLALIQDRSPERFSVVTPAATETYRVATFAAYYRLVKRRLFDALDDVPDGIDEIPSPTEHCEVCRWWRRCNGARRRVDHLSFVAHLGRSQQEELVRQGVTTLAALAQVPLPIPFKPTRGSRATFEQLREQARLQLAQRDARAPVFELLPPRAGFGLAVLPAPSPGDLFLDLEGARFAREGGREYLFGLGRLDAHGVWRYVARWAVDDEEEARAFEGVMDAISSAVRADPGAHVYHFAPYEPSAFKRLMGRHATRSVALDELLRGERFVDLLAVVRQAIRAGVESYSIKALEPFYGFTRAVELAHAGDQRRLVDEALEAGDPAAIDASARDAVERYNEDDCRSTLELRNWLERLRDARVASGIVVERPGVKPADATEQVRERQARIDALRENLLALRTDAPAATAEALRLLAYLIDWHYREDKVEWWEFFRLRDLPDEDLVDERLAVTGLEFIEHLRPALSARTGKPTKSMIDRYTYPPQECEIRAGDGLHTRTGSFGTVDAVDRLARIIDIKTTQTEVHPTSAFVHDHVSVDALSAAVCGFGDAVLAQGFDGASGYRPAIDLLLRRPATIGGGPLASVSPMPDESVAAFAARIVTSLDDAVLPIQGPPGSGKTRAGGRMIVALVRAGRRVGVTGTSHKVIGNLLTAVLEAAAETNVIVRCGHKGDEDDMVAGVARCTDNADAASRLAAGEFDVMGGTAFLWARPEFAGTVDTLFVDEAGQMSLANAIAVSRAARRLVLLGDPRQLEQPQKGAHPDGVGVSALDHLLGGRETMPADRGLFLPTTWRLAPALCTATSELFYERRLSPAPGVERVRLTGAGRFDGAGLWIVESVHDGNRGASDEEAEVVVGLVNEILSRGPQWTDRDGASHRLTDVDILVVAPYNAHVNRVEARLRAEGRATRVGTVDKFQGQEAPVVIYTMATSSPEDAPRGLEFLYSASRLNVATSRARAAAILVAAPRLFAPECRTPRQMALANALCRLREIAVSYPVPPK